MKKYIILFSVILIMLISVYQSFQIQSVKAQINTLSTNVLKSTGATANPAQIDTTGWSEDEKMMYEHHGTLPARIQGSQPQQNMVGGC